MFSPDPFSQAEGWENWQIRRQEGELTWRKVEEGTHSALNNVLETSLAPLNQGCHRRPIVKWYKITNNQERHAFLKGGRTKVGLVVLLQTAKLAKILWTLHGNCNQKSGRACENCPLFTDSCHFPSPSYTYGLTATKTHMSILLPRTAFDSEAWGKGWEELKLTRNSMSL